MLQLIQKLVQATEPSRALDAEIDAALRIGLPTLPQWTWKNFSKWRGGPDGRVEVVHHDGSGGINWESAPFTSSIDAALTLLRKHYLFELKRGIECHATVWWLEHDWDDTGAPTAYTTTYPAMALATAALIAISIEDRVREPA